MKSINQLKTGILAVLAVVFCMMLPVKTEAADIQAVPMSLNNSWISGNIGQEGEVDFYRFTTTKAGWVTISYQGFSVRDSYVRILDNDLAKEYDSAELWYTSAQNPKTKDFTFAFEAGTYYIKIYGAGSNVGDYRLKGSFEAAGNNETEVNNDFATAMTLNPNQLVTGFISLDDSVDFFKISVPNKKGVRLIFTSYMYDSYMEVWNSDFRSISKKEVWYAGKTNPKTYVYEEVLDAGVYYIKIYPSRYTNTGKYMLKYEEKVLASSISVSGKKQMVAGTSTRLSAKISPSNATYKDITWTTGNSNSASVDSTGKVTANIVGKDNITASATDGSNQSKIFTIVVTPKKLNKPHLSSVGKKKMYVSWTMQSGVSGYKIQYSKKKNFKGAKTVKASKNKTSKTISKLSKTKYYVRVCAYYKSGSKTYNGKWSSAKSIRIRR